VVLREFPFDNMRYVLGRESIYQPFDYATIVAHDQRVDCGAINFEFIDEFEALLNPAIFAMELLIEGTALDST